MLSQGFTGGIEPHDGVTSGCLMVGYTPSIKTTTRTRTFDWTGGGGLGNRNWSSLHPRGTEFDEAKRKEIYAETQRLTQEYLHLAFT